MVYYARDRRSPARRHRRGFRGLLAAFAAATLLAAGCSAGEDEPADTPTAGQPGQQQDWASDMASCMADRGWEIQVVEEDRMRAEIPTDQQDRYDADIEACHDETGYDMNPPAVTDAEAEAYYDGFLPVVECLREHDFPVVEPPSRQAFVDETVRETVVAWHPYEAMYGQEDLTQLTEAEEVCPVPES